MKKTTRNKFLTAFLLGASLLLSACARENRISEAVSEQKSDLSYRNRSIEAEDIGIDLSRSSYEEETEKAETHAALSGKEQPETTVSLDSGKNGGAVSPDAGLRDRVEKKNLSYPKEVEAILGAAPGSEVLPQRTEAGVPQAKARTISEGPQSAETEAAGGLSVPENAPVRAAGELAITAQSTAVTGAAAEQPLETVSWNACYIEGDEIILKGSAGGAITPAGSALGADPNFYLLELDPYDDDVSDNRYTVSTPKMFGAIELRLPLNLGMAESRLYKKFIMCIWDGQRYRAVSEPVYINNPEVTAKYQDAYTEPLTKKGLLIELPQIADAFELGVGHVIVNIPYNAVLGSGIEYVYEGETYHFNKEIIEAYDKTVSMFSNKGMLVTAILLNGWNDSTPDYYYPGTQKTSAANYYHFNTKTEAGYKDLKAVASFLADRYSGRNSDYGRIQNWIIGNEVNNQLWNYIGPMDLQSYINEFERTFRVFYTAIKSTCANNRVFFSTDYNWMYEANGSTKYNAKEFIDGFAALVRQRGNIDWGLAYHPYSVPLTEPEFWDDPATGLVTWEESSPVVNFANLAVLTNYMQRPELLDRSGNVRHIILSEQGFTSQSLTRGEVEKLQAAAFAYAYYIVDSNPYIDAFILSRQIDAPSEAAMSCAFGLWTTDAEADSNITPAQRKYIWPVFKAIDKKKETLERTEFAKEILGIEKWSDIIPDFRWAQLEN